MVSPFSSMSSSPEFGSGSSTIESMNDINLVRYAIITTFALQFYDYITVLDDEVHYIWRSRDPFSRHIPFLINRYVPFLTAISATYFMLLNPDHSLCQPAHYAVGLVALTGGIIAECTIFLRVYAVYGRNKVVMVFLVSVALISAGGTAFNTVYYISRSTTVSMGENQLGCLYLYRLKIEWISLVVLIVCESAAFCLFVYKAVAKSRYSSSFIMDHLYKDAIIWFLCTIGCSVANLLVQFFASNLLCDALLIPQAVLQQIICVHFSLRIRRSYEYNLVSVSNAGSYSH